MQHGPPGSHVVAEGEAGGVHAQRPEDVLLEVVVEPLTRDLFNHAAHEVDADAVHPALSGIEQRRNRLRPPHQLAAGDRVSPGGLLVSQQELVPELVAEAGRVGQQVPQGDRTCGRAHQGPAVVVEAFEHARFGQIGQHARRGLVQKQLAPLH